MPVDKNHLIHEIYRQSCLQGIPSPLVTRLVKLLYLADLEWRRRHRGEPLTNLTWKFLHFGPYAFELADTLGGPEVEVAEFKGGRVGRRVAFSAEELHQSLVPDGVGRLIEDLVARWGAVDLNLLLDHVYFDTEPMQEAVRGAILDFSKLVPIENLPTPQFDQKKMRELRERLRGLALRLNLNRGGIRVPAVDLVAEKVWDEDERSSPFPPGTNLRFD